MSNLKQISTYTVLTILVASLILPIATVLGQVGLPVQIVSVTSPAYPGETVTVTLDIGLATTVTVRLCNDAGCTYTWASQVFTPPTAGRYTLTLSLPEKLPGLTNWNGTCRYGYVSVSTVFGGLSQEFCIAPKIRVSPPSTAPVKQDGSPVTVTVEFLGYVPGDTVSQVVLSGPATYTVTVSAAIGSDGYGSTTVDLKAITGQGIPRGTYKVYGVGTQTTDFSKAKLGSLEIKPQVVITPTEGNGRCDASVCELTGISIYGYGFDPNVAIVSILLKNINFTKVIYTVTPPTGFATNANGYFVLTNLKQYIAGGKGTNMTAGLYIVNVTQAPLPKTLSNTSTIDLAKTGSVVISESAIVSALGVRASITATSYVDGELDYVPKTSTMAYTLTEVLRIDITYAGKKYQLAANVEDLATRSVRFALYNTTVTPYVTMFSTTATATLNTTIGAYIADIWFNIVPVGYTTTPTPPPGQYRYWASFYIYPNQILLLLREWSFIVTKANLTITYVNKDTGVTIKRFFVYPTNMSVDTVVKVSDKFTEGGIEWSISWSYDPSTKVASISVTGKPLKGPSFEFRNVYYIVRPLLVLLTPMPILPGQKATIAAYGYAPGAYWGHIPPGYDDNYLDVYWEKIVKLGTFRLGKDGNLTFTVTIPSDASFGVHYIWGVDKWNYEYTLAIIIGARAYYTIVPPPGFVIPPTPIVSAGYMDKRVTVCPCPATYVGLSYCAKCVVYVGRCDYLGDEIKVVLSGVSPGETITVYFADRAMKTVKANTSVVEVSFIVPTVPEGNYTLYAIGTVSGTIYVSDYFNGTKFVTSPAMVRPKILLVDLNKDILPILVGPGFVRVLGTGFRPGVSFVGMLVNKTDAAFTLNVQVQRWGADDRGVLINTYSKDIVPGLFIPALEPGAYGVSLLYIVGTVAKTSLPGYIYVINNLSIVATKFDVATILSKIDDTTKLVQKAIDEIYKAQKALDKLNKTIIDLSKVIATKSDIDTVLKSLAEAKSVLDSLSKTVAPLPKGIDDIKSLIVATMASIADLKATAATKGDIQTLSGKLDSVLSGINSAISKLDGLSRTLGDVQKALGAVATKSDVDDIKSAISDVKNAVTDVKNSIPIDTINEIRTRIATALDTLTQARNEIAAIRTDVTGLKSDVAGIKSDVATVKSTVDAVKSDTAKLTGIETTLNAVKSSTDKLPGIESRLGSVDDSVSTVRTLVILALVFAVIAAAAAIYATIAISRAVAK
jgi:predicted  nucleic acid-binding Zn-ribbon protein